MLPIIVTIHFAVRRARERGAREDEQRMSFQVLFRMTMGF